MHVQLAFGLYHRNGGDLPDHLFREMIRQFPQRGEVVPQRRQDV